LVDAKLPNEGSITLVAQLADLSQQSVLRSVCLCFRYILGKAPTRDDFCEQNEAAQRYFIPTAVKAA
jgi:hypothetical protein